jgi:hypothetical protein
MNLLEQPPSDTNFPCSTSNVVKSKNTRAALRNIAWSALLVAALIVVLGTRTEINVLAKTAQATDDKAASQIDPDAMKALETMGTYLRTLKSFQVDSQVSNDDVLDDGEIVTYSRKDTLLAARPNRLRVEMKGDDKNVFLFYDGKNFTVYGKIQNYYATVPAPATIGELIDKVNDKYDIEVPLVDLFMWGTDESTIKKITSASDIGPGVVDDVTCEHYSFRQDGVDWQIWIQLGDYPLPRKIVIRTLSDDARPEHTAVLSWNLAPSFNDVAFTFEPPNDAKRIVLQDFNADSTKK